MIRLYEFESIRFVAVMRVSMKFRNVVGVYQSLRVLETEVNLHVKH